MTRADSGIDLTPDLTSCLTRNLLTGASQTLHLSWDLQERRDNTYLEGLRILWNNVYETPDITSLWHRVSVQKMVTVNYQFGETSYCGVLCCRCSEVLRRCKADHQPSSLDGIGGSGCAVCYVVRPIQEAEGPESHRKWSVMMDTYLAAQGGGCLCWWASTTGCPYPQGQVVFFLDTLTNALDSRLLSSHFVTRNGTSQTCWPFFLDTQSDSCVLEALGTFFNTGYGISFLI